MSYRVPMRNPIGDAYQWLADNWIYPLIAILILLLGLLCYAGAVAREQERDACRAKGGIYHCTSSTGMGISTNGKSVITSNTACECYTTDGRLLLDGQ